MKTFVLSSLLAAAAALPAHAQTFQWNQQAGGTTADEGRGVAVDAQGNAYVTGVFRGVATFGTAPNQVALTSTPPIVGTAPTADMFLAKYAPSGTLLWARRGGGPGTEEAGGVALDAQGNPSVIGSYSGTATFEPGSAATPPTLTSAGGDDMFLVKYSAAGVLLDSRGVGSANASAESGYAAATDSVGNVYITGEFRDTPLFNGSPASPPLTSAGNTDVLVAKYSPTGVLLWARRGGAADSDVGRAIAVDRAGACVVTGSFRGAATFEGGPGSTPVSIRARSGSADVFVVKYDANGTPLWGRVGYGPGVKIGRGICTDRRKDIYLMTYFNDSLLLTSTRTDSVKLKTNANNRDVVVVKYSPQGSIVWTRPAGGPALDTGINIAADAQNNVYALSYFQQTMSFPAGVSTPGVPDQTVTAAGSSDAVVASYTSAGALRWLRRMGGPLDDLGYGLAPDASGNLLLTGYFTGGPFTVDGNLPLFTQPSNVRDIFVSRLQNILTSTSSSRLAADLQAWPNPTADVLHLRLATRQSATATLLDALGRELQTVPMLPSANGQQTTDLSLAKCAAGLYLVRVSSGESSTTLRVIRP